MDIAALKKRFENKKKNMALYIRNENASHVCDIALFVPALM